MRKKIYSLCPVLIATALSLTLNACSESGATVTPASTTATISSGVFSSTAAGVSIRIPNRITGDFDANSGRLGFKNADNSLGGIVFGGSAGGAQAGASRAIRTLLPQLELEVAQVLDDSVNPQGTAASSQFIATSRAGAQVFMRLDVRQGPTGNYIAVLGNSATNEQAVLNALVSEMTDSVVFGNPASPTHTIDLTGIELQANNINSNLVGDGSLTSGDEGYLLTCTDGRYNFFSKSMVLFNFGEGTNGGSGSTTETLQHTGAFTGHVDFGGNQLISLHSQSQGTFVFNVARGNNSTVLLDQVAYKQTGSSEEQCAA